MANKDDYKTKEDLRAENIKKLREKSGSVTSKSNTVAFFYILMRDHMTPGEVANIISDITENDGENVFTNGWLAEYAKHIVDELNNN